MSNPKTVDFKLHQGMRVDQIFSICEEAFDATTNKQIFILCLPNGAHIPYEENDQDTQAVSDWKNLRLKTSLPKTTDQGSATLDGGVFIEFNNVLAVVQGYHNDAGEELIIVFMRDGAINVVLATPHNRAILGAWKPQKDWAP